MITDHTYVDKYQALFSMISFDFNLSKSLILEVKKNLYFTSHHAPGLCLTQLDSISLPKCRSIQSLELNLSIHVQ